MESAGALTIEADVSGHSSLVPPVPDADGLRLEETGVRRADNDVRTLPPDVPRGGKFKLPMFVVEGDTERLLGFAEFTKEEDRLEGFVGDAKVPQDGRFSSDCSIRLLSGGDDVLIVTTGRSKGFNVSFKPDAAGSGDFGSL